MENQICSSCENTKPSLECGLCQSTICKSCAHFMDQECFSFMKSIPSDLAHDVYCPNCFNEKISAAIETYKNTLEQAKNILVYNKSQGKETRFVKRTVKPIKVESCADHDEVILRLAFAAAEANFNAIVSVDIKSEKVRNGSYQTTRWSGTAIPANVQERQLLKDRANWDNPN